MLQFPCSPRVELIAFLALLGFAANEGTQASDTTAPSNSPTSAGRMNCGAQIECVTPDGHPGRISRLPAQDPTATALIMEDDTVTCVLQEGETNFVIELPHVVVPDRFTFLNENGRARGELKISVSNRHLAPDSSQWKEVEGVIPFVHKRLFGVSLLGIEAKYVRLSFRVQKGTGAAVASSSQERLTNNAEAVQSAVTLSNLALAALDTVLNNRNRITDPGLLGYSVGPVRPLALSSN